MRLNIKAAALAGGVCLGLGILFVGVFNQLFPPYGDQFLRMMASVYPGVRYPGGFGSVVAGTIGGFIDGAIGAAILSWIYNLLRTEKSSGHGGVPVH